MLVALVSALESLAIPYMVSGSLATNVYGVPRPTDDGDFVVELPDVEKARQDADELPVFGGTYCQTTSSGEIA
jgi:hypothetical protein